MHTAHIHSIRLFFLILSFITAGEAFSTSATDPLLPVPDGNPNLASEQSTVDITHQELRLQLDPRERYIRGHVTTTFRTENDPTTHLTLDLHRGLIIDSIISHDGIHLTYERDTSHTTRITLAQILYPGQFTSVHIYYQGIPPENGLGSFVQTEHATDAIIWTLSEPYGARDWWPCGQNLTDKVDSLDLWITVPEGYRAASNGLLLSETPTQDDRITFHWQHRYPIATYLVAVAVSNYQVHTFEIPLTHGPLPIVNYLYPQNYDVHSRQIESILPPMMQLYEELFIPYPFHQEKYGHAQFGFGGGMEHQTMSFMGSFSYSLVAHELAHQWFGDYLTCGSWQDIWLNEGFADYLTGLAYERITKDGRWENHLESAINSITSAPGGSLWVPDTTDISQIFSSRLSYRKGGMVLHMLRWVLGDDDFFEGIRRYLTDETTQYAFVRTWHLKQHLEAVSGHDLTEFFEDWYLGEGYPSFQVQWRNTDHGLYLKIHQTTSHPSVDFFEMPVEIGVYSPEQDSLLRLDFKEDGQEFEIAMPWTVDSLAFDPRMWLISANNTTEVVTGLEDFPVDSPYHIFPNPTAGAIHIHNTSSSAIRQIALYSTHGKLLFSEPVSVSPGLIYELDVTRHPTGLYILVLRSANGRVSSYKIVKR